MKKGFFALLFLFAFSGVIQAQQYGTREGKVTFSASTPLETIEPKNEKVSSILDASTGKLEFALQIKGFLFEKALMGEHFNETYMESNKFPAATFKGTILDLKTVNFSKDGVYPVAVKGDLTMHGVTKPISTKGTLTVKGNTVTAASSFEVPVADYNIAIPSPVREKIAKIVKINVSSVMPKL